MNIRLLLTGIVLALAGLPARERAKVRFIHLNHTNPALVEGGEAARAIERAGCRVASQGERLGL